MNGVKKKYSFCYVKENKHEQHLPILTGHFYKIDIIEMITKQRPDLI